MHILLVYRDGRIYEGGAHMNTQKLEYQNVLGDPLTREEVMLAIEQSQETYLAFQKFPEELQEELIAFCMGNWGLKITYDPFFKYIFNPELKPERLTSYVAEMEILRSRSPNRKQRLQNFKKGDGYHDEEKDNNFVFVDFCNVILWMQQGRGRKARRTERKCIFRDSRSRYVYRQGLRNGIR